MSAKTLRNLLTAVLILVVGGGASVILIKSAKKPERQAPPPVRPLVSTVTVAPELEPVRVQGFGSVKAKQTVDVVPQVSGRVVARSAQLEPGAYVRRDEVLLRLEDTDYVLAVQQARANVAQAEVNLAQAEEEALIARREWDRIGADGFGTDGAGAAAEPTPLVLREPQLKLARANLEAARAALQQAKLNLTRCTLVAPFDGRVLRCEVDVGQFLAAGMAVGRLYATDVAEITVPVADADLAWINADIDGADVDVSAQFAGARHHWRGRAVRLGGAVDAASRQVPVVVEVDNPYRRTGDRPALIEGMFVEVEFTSPPPADAVVIPRTALRPGDQVWVVDAEDRLRIRDVTVARAGVEQAVITAGLAAGETICTSNLQYVTDGMPVRREDATPTVAGQAQTASEGGSR